jgi:electron transfer flavoprotein beta subunit
MKVLVPVKHVIDANVRPQVKSDGSGVNLAHVKMSINPFCEIAVEESVKMKEAGTVSEIILVTIGNSKSQESLRKGLAMGADRAIHVETEQNLEPLAIAKILTKITEKEQPNMVILGKQTIDNDNNQTGQMLSALLGWPQGTFASKIDVDSNSVNVTREIDGGLETLSLKLPAVITTDLRLNEPRNVTLPNLMKAKQKPIENISVEELGIDTTPRTKTLNVSSPEVRKAGIKVESIAELVEKLQTEAGVL